VEQELLTLSEHLCPPPVFSGVRVSRSLVLFVDRCLSFFFWPLWCLSFFDLQILITSLVSSSSFDHLQDDIEKVQEGQESLQKDMRKLKQNIKDIQIQNNKLENMITALLKKEGVGFEEEDFQDAEAQQ
jgi:hypothetical protein